MKFDDRSASDVIELLKIATAAMLEDPNRHGSTVRIPARGNLLATGDLHDNPMHLAMVIQLARLDASTDNHVVVHELIHGERLVNGLDLSYRMIVKVAKLQLDHPGQVHVVLANHELSQMAGHPVSKGGSDMTANFDEGLDWVFGEDAQGVARAISEYVLAMPLALLTGNGIMCSHSLPGPSQMTRFDMDVLKRPLCQDDYAPLLGSAWMMVWGRGQTEEQMEKIAEEWGGFVVLPGARICGQWDCHRRSAHNPPQY